MSEEYGKNGADHSQWGEQKIILEYFGDHVGRFLDLGAYDGITGSNSRGLSDRYWRGVCIEASAFNFARLSDNHRLNEKIICVNAAVVPKPGLYELHETMGQLSTVAKDGRADEWVQRRYWVPGVTPDQIADAFGNDFDFISFDIEGVDLDVIKVSGRLLEHAKLVCVEDAIPCSSLNENGYYDHLMGVLAAYGFSKVVGRTTNIETGLIANTLIARP